MRSRLPLLIPVLLLLAGPAGAVPRGEAPSVVLRGVAFPLALSDPDLAPDDSLAVQVAGAGAARTAWIRGGESTEVTVMAGRDGVRLFWEGGEATVTPRVLPGWTSILPPLVAIVLAIAFRQVIAALLVGVWLGAVLVLGTNPAAGFLRTFDTYIVGSVADTDHVRILVFSFLLGGMLGVIQRSGGSRGIVALVSPHARTARSGQLSTWVMGLIIFFDDYANSLLVGSTMRPLTDRLRISREKLAYIVDSTAAPVTSIAIVSTWIGVEVGLIHDAFAELDLERDAFAAFVSTIPYRFYPIFALVFGFLVAITGRDFGPMLKAERRARRTGKVLRDGAMPLADFESTSLEPPEDRPHRWINAALPVLVMVVSVLGFIYASGRRAAMAAGDPLDLKTIVGSADSYEALLWASALGLTTALILAVGQRILSLNQGMEAAVQGIKSMLGAAIILILAWSVGMVTTQMHTAGYLVHLLGDALNPRLLPALVFIFSGLTSFATGSSWGTMGILMPLVVPLAYHMGPGNELLLMGVISGVLAGSVWGDHCSPISDTTVLSSMASASDHIDHVNTQLPYALVVGGVSLILGDVATAYGVPFWVSWIAGAGLLFVILRLFGKRSADYAEP
jgi:Na+/H+ antiporter NhaC